MKITIWDKQININDDIANAFRKCGYEINELTLSSILITDDIEKSSNEKDIAKAIEKGMKDYIEMEQAMPSIIKKIEAGEYD